MNRDTILFELAIEYINGDSELGQSSFLRNKLGESSASSQVEFSKYCVASKPEWQKTAQKYREEGKQSKCAPGSYKESVFKRALKIYDHQKANEARKAPAKRKSRGSDRDKATASAEKKRKTHIGSRKEEEDEEEVAPPDFKALKASLMSLKDGLHNAQVHHDYVSKALVDERKTAKALQKESSSLEVKLDEVIESLGIECRARERLKTENKRLRDDLAQRSKDSEAFVQNRHANKRLKKENARLKQELEATKEMPEEPSAIEAKALENQRMANEQLQKRLADLRQELHASNVVHHRATESLTFQTSRLQHERKKRAMLEGNLQNMQSTSTTAVQSATEEIDRNSARRISM
jgi:hypothetical protein